MQYDLPCSSGNSGEIAMHGSQARALDQFYTKACVAKLCVAELLRFLQDRYSGAIWIEPSAGKGAFVDHLPAPRIALDIAPQRPDISCVDFLQWSPGQLTRKAIVVGNPPFGKNSSLAQRFFNHSAQFASVVAFIVPRTFQKQSMVNRLDPLMHLQREIEIPDEAFEFIGEAYHVPTVFQIWERGTMVRQATQRKLSHPDFAFVPPGNADFAFQRVGARAGLVSHEGLRKSPQSHYFLKSNIDPEGLFSRLKTIDWNEIKWRTAGNPSIGKGELIERYEAEYA